jgi:uncharacterized protein (TIGR02646 family)
MRTIQKGVEPTTLTQHRKQPHADYDNYPDKETLRNALVAEQRGLCCYCQSRIRSSPEYMKIEHWQCQEAHPDRQLDFSNLHGACLGGEGKPYREQHCDTRKGNDVLYLKVCDPTRPIEHKIHFMGDGRISSDDPAIEHDINKVLNLNIARLVNNRKAVLTAFKERLTRVQRLDPARELRKWDGSQPGELEPFAQVVVYYLRKRQTRAIR